MFKTLMFEPLEPTVTIDIELDGKQVQVPANISVAAALLLGLSEPYRHSKIDGTASAPYCMMGVCAECLVTINNEPNQFACQRRVEAGMRVQRILSK